ncbi:unnamed protein product [Phytophthora fragariaefolia]|uniref:Unnamed protein product n=1 Tax=Phytophthora fragariaefolia TaxID=1490495 RepID=A0A9W6Y9F2_9STRA|nr:unnamed protein product [Phytophthora fragariaefolia]
MVSAALSPIAFSGVEIVDVSAGHIASHDLSDGYLCTPVQDAEIATSVVQMQHVSSLGWTWNLIEEFIKAYRTDPGFRDKYRSPHCPYLLKDRLLYVQSSDNETKVMRLCVPRAQRNCSGAAVACVRGRRRLTESEYESVRSLSTDS